MISSGDKDVHSCLHFNSYLASGSEPDISNSDNDIQNVI